jgi:hypothetical protein
MLEQDIPFLLADVYETVPVLALVAEQDTRWVKVAAFQHESHGSVVMVFNEDTIDKLALALTVTISRWRQWREVFVKVLENQFPFYIDWKGFLRYESGLEASKEYIPLSRELRTQAFHHLRQATRSLFNSVLNREQTEHESVRMLLEWLDTRYIESTFREVPRTPIQVESVA